MKLTPMLAEAAGDLLAGDAAAQELGTRLAASFNLAATEPKLIAIVENESAAPGGRGAALRALASFGSKHSELFAKLAETASDTLLRDEALAALAVSKAEDAPARLLALYPKVVPAQRRTALDRLSESKPGASAIVAALTSGAIPTAISMARRSTGCKRCSARMTPRSTSWWITSARSFARYSCSTAVTTRGRKRTRASMDL
ncbi:MAG: hypothetical protein WDN28_26905 [Chthoniobacter sp.]